MSPRKILYFIDTLEIGGAEKSLLELLTEYEHNIANAPAGQLYQECYDVRTGKPGQEYVTLYGEVMDELRSMGLNVRGGA